LFNISSNSRLANSDRFLKKYAVPKKKTPAAEPGLFGSGFLLNKNFGEPHREARAIRS
jgi:hypothetical protein